MDMVQNSIILRFFKDRLNKVSDGLAIELKEKEVCGLNRGEK